MPEEKSNLKINKDLLNTATSKEIKSSLNVSNIINSDSQIEGIKPLESYGFGNISTPDPTGGKYGIGYIPSNVITNNVYKELNTYKANNQPTWDKIGNMLGRGILKTGTTIIEPLGHILDLQSWFDKDNRKKQEYTNVFNELINGINNSIDENMPIYTQEESPNPIISKDWWLQHGDGLISMLGFLVTFGVAEKGIGLALKGMSTYLKGLKLTKTIKGIELGTKVGTKTIKYLSEFEKTGKLNKLLSTLGASTLFSHSSGMDAASQVFKTNKGKYIQHFKNLYPNYTAQRINELATNQAAEDAETVMKNSRVNILFYSLGIGNLFKGVKATSTFKSLMGKQALLGSGKSAITLGLMGTTGKFISEEGLREGDIKSGLIKDDGTNKIDRYLTSTFSKEGLSELSVGLINGLMLHGFQYFTHGKARYLAREQLKENAAKIKDINSFNDLNDQQFYEVLYNNAAKGTMINVKETLDRIANITPKEAEKLKYNKDYKYKAKEFKDKAIEFEGDFNDVGRVAQKNTELIPKLLNEKYKIRTSTKEINRLENVIKELETLEGNPDEQKSDIAKIKNLKTKENLVGLEINRVKEELNTFTSKDIKETSLFSGSTRDELEYKLKLLNDKKNTLSINTQLEANKYRDKLIKNKIEVTLNGVDRKLTNSESKDIENKIDKQLDNELFKMEDGKRKIRLSPQSQLLFSHKARLEQQIAIRDASKNLYSELESSESNRTAYSNKIKNNEEELKNEFKSNTKNAIKDIKTVDELIEAKKLYDEHPNIDASILDDVFEKRFKEITKDIKDKEEKQNLINQFKNYRENKEEIEENKSKKTVGKLNKIINKTINVFKKERPVEVLDKKPIETKDVEDVENVSTRETETINTNATSKQPKSQPQSQPQSQPFKSTGFSSKNNKQKIKHIVNKLLDKKEFNEEELEFYKNNEIDIEKQKINAKYTPIKNILKTSKSFILNKKSVTFKKGNKSTNIKFNKSELIDIKKAKGDVNKINKIINEIKNNKLKELEQQSQRDIKNFELNNNLENTDESSINTEIPVSNKEEYSKQNDYKEEFEQVETNLNKNLNDLSESDISTLKGKNKEWLSMLQSLGLDRVSTNEQLYNIVSIDLEQVSPSMLSQMDKLLNIKLEPFRKLVKQLNEFRDYINEKDPVEKEELRYMIEDMDKISIDEIPERIEKLEKDIQSLKKEKIDLSDINLVGSEYSNIFDTYNKRIEKLNNKYETSDLNNEHSAIKIELSKLENKEINENDDYIEDLTDELQSNNVKNNNRNSIINFIHGGDNTSYGIIHKTDNNVVYKINDLIIEGGESLAFLGMEYEVTEHRDIKTNKKYHKKYTISNKQLNDNVRILTNEIQAGHKLKFEIDPETKDLHNDEKSIIVLAEHNGKLIKIGNVHTPKWIKNVNEKTGEIDYNVAESTKYDDNNINTQLLKNKQLRDAIISNIDKGEKVFGSIEYKNNGRPVENLMMKDGKIVLDERGNPIIEKGKVIDLLPEKTQFAVSIKQTKKGKTTLAITGLKQQLTNAFKKDGFRAGTVFKVVKNNLGETDLLPLIKPTLKNSKGVINSIINYLNIHYNNINPNELNKKAGIKFINNSNDKSISKYLGNFFNFKEFNMNKVIYLSGELPSGAERYLFNIKKDGTFTFADVSANLIYELKKGNIATRTTANGRTINVTNDIFISQLEVALNDKKAYIPIRVDANKINKTSISFNELLINKKGNEYDVSNTVHKDYNSYLENKLETTYNGLDVDTKGNYIYYTTPNVGLKLDGVNAKIDVAVDNKKVEVKTKIEPLESGEPDALNNLFGLENENKNKYSILPTTEKTQRNAIIVNTNTKDKNKISSLSSFIIPDLGNFTNQNDIVSHMLSGVLDEYIGYFLNNNDNIFKKKSINTYIKEKEKLYNNISKSLIDLSRKVEANLVNNSDFIFGTDFSKNDKIICKVLSITDKEQLDKKLETYQTVTTNFDKLIKHAKYKLQQLGIIKEKNKSELDLIELGEESDYVKNAYDDLAKFKINPKSVTSPLFKSFLYSLPNIKVIDGVEQVERNVLGFNNTIDPDLIYNKLQSLLANKCRNFDDIIRVLKENKKYNPIYDIIAEKLTNNPNLKSVATEVVNSLAKYRHSFQTLRLFSRRDANGKLKKISSELYFNDSVSGKFGIRNNWAEQFKISDVIKYEGNIATYDLGKIANIKDHYNKVLSKYKNNYNSEEFYKEFQNLLNNFNINLNLNTISDIITLPQLLGFQGVNEIVGLGKNTFLNSLFSKLQGTGFLEEISPFSDKIFNAHLFKLANIEMKYNEQRFDNSVLNSQNQLIFQMQNYSYLSSIFKDIRDEESPILKNLSKTSLSKHSLLVKHLLLNSNLRNKVGLSFFDASSKGKFAKSIERKNMDINSQNIMAFELFKNGTNDRTNFITTTFGESSIVPIFTFPKQKLNLYFDKGKVKVGNETIDLAYSQLQGEIDRISKFQASNKKPLSKEYGDGAGYFLLNTMFNKKELTKAEAKELYKGDKLQITKKGINIIREKLRNNLETYVEDIFNDFVDNKVVLQKPMIVTYPDKTKKHVTRITSPLIDEKDIFKYKNSIIDKKGNTPIMDKGDIESNVIKLMIADFAINNKFMNHEIFALLGDPALATKLNKTTGEIDFDATYSNYQKRAKAMLSPFETGNWETPTFRSVTVKDLVLPISELKEYGYDKVTVSDGFELTTLKESILFKLAYNNIPNRKLALNIINKIDAAIADKNNKRNIPNLNEIEKAIVLGGTKPVLYSRETSETDDVNYIHFRKSGALALNPFMTESTELDKIRIAMENSQIDRLGFKTADKLGAGNEISIFDENGKVLNNLIFNENDVQTLGRENFGKQVHMPTHKTSINLVTQLDITAFDNIRDIKDFNFKSNKDRSKFKKYTGRELELEKERIRNKLMELGKTRLYDRLGVKFENDDFIFSDLSLLKNTLVKEAISLKWTDIDIQNLEITDDGKSFEFPLLFNNSFNRIQDLLFSIVNDEVIKTKFKGSGDVQCPDLGFNIIEPKNYSGIDNAEMLQQASDRIIYMDKYDSSTKLKHLRFNKNKSVRPMQVLVNWNFTNNYGNLLDIKNYIKLNDKGQAVLDTELLPKEVLQGIYSRIPNQNHSSSVPFEIVGFLPKNMKKIVIVPDGITEQMGSDFDIDKLYSYLTNYIIDKNGKLNKIDKLDAITELKLELEEKSKYDKIVTKFKELKDNDNLIMEKVNLALDKFTKSKSDIDEKAYLKLVKAKENSNNELQDYKTKYDIKSTFNELKKTKNYIKGLERIDERLLLQEDYKDLMWSIKTHPEVVKKSLNPLSNNDIENEVNRINKKTKKDITSWIYQRNSFIEQQNGKQLIGVTALSNVYNSYCQVHDLYIKKEGNRSNIFIKDDNGEVLALEKLGRTGKSFFIDEKGNNIIRTSSENIQSILDATVDNGANPKLGRANISKDNINSIITFLRLKDENGNCGNINYGIRLVNQPIVLEFLSKIKEYQNSESDIPRGTEIENAKEFINNKYNKEEIEPTNILSSKHLLDMINFKRSTDKKLNDEYLYNQLSAFNLFTDIYDLSNYDSKLMGTSMSSVRKGAGQNIFESIILSEDIREHIINNARIENAHLLLGDLKFINDQPVIDYNTQLGIAYKNTSDFANKAFGDLFKINTSSIRNIIKTYKKNSNRDLSGKILKNIINEVKKSVFCSRTGLANNDNINIIRNKLLIDGKVNKSLYTEIQEYLGKSEIKNPFLKSLKLKTTDNQYSPKRLAYQNVAGESFSEIDNIQHINNMLVSLDPELKNIGNKLVQYTYLIGGVFNPISFTKYIDANHLRNLRVDKNLRAIDFNNITKDTHSFNPKIFLKQFYQHQPWETDRINMKELSKGNPIYARDNSLLEFTTKDKKPSQFLSYRDRDENANNDSWKIYEYKGLNINHENVYARIDALGNANKTGIYIAEYNLNNYNQTSAMMDNRAIRNYVLKNKLVSTKFPDSKIKKLITIKNPKANQKKINKYAPDYKLNTALDRINSNEHYSIVGKTLKAFFKKRGLDISLDLNGDLKENMAGVYNNGHIKMNKMLNDASYSGKKIFENKLLHEAMHGFTDETATNYLDPKLRKLNTPEINAIYTRIEDIRNKVLNDLKIKDVDTYNKLKTEFDKLDKNKKSSFTTKISDLYGLYDLREYMSELVVNENFQKYLNEVKIGKQTAFKKVVGLITKMFIKLSKHLGIKIKSENALLHSLREIIELGSNLEKIPFEKRVDDFKDLYEKGVETPQTNRNKDDVRSSILPNKSKQLDLFNDTELHNSLNKDKEFKDDKKENINKIDKLDEKISDLKSKQIGKKEVTKKSILNGLINRGIINKSSNLNKDEYTIKYNDTPYDNYKSNSQHYVETLYKMQQYFGLDIITINEKARPNKRTITTFNINEKELEKFNNKNNRYSFKDANNIGFNVEYQPLHSNEVFDMINACNNQITLIRRKMLGITEQKEIFKLDDRIDSIKEIRDAINENGRINNIYEQANNHLDLAEDILNKPIINESDLKTASAITTSWSEETTRNYLNDKQKLNPNNTAAKYYKKLNDRAIDINNKIMDLEIKQIQQLGKDVNLKQDISIDNIKYMDEINDGLKLLDLYKVDNPVVQALGIHLVDADRNPTGAVNDYIFKINKLFSNIEQDVALSKAIGKDYRLLHKLDEDGNPTLDMVDKYSVKYDIHKSEYAKKLADLDYKYEHGEISNKEDYYFEKNIIIRDHYSKEILIDLVALGLNGDIGTRNNPDYTFKDPSDYKKYLIKELGIEDANEAIASAELSYQQYISKKRLYKEWLEDEGFSKKEFDTKYEEWVNDNNPISMLNKIFAGSRDEPTSNNAFKYLVNIPRKTININGEKVDTGFYDKNFKSIMSNPKLKTFYNEYNEIMTELLTKLPSHTVSRLSSNFLPKILKSLLDGAFNENTNTIASLNSKLIDNLASKDVSKLKGFKESTYITKDDKGKPISRLPLSFLKQTEESYMYSKDLKENLKLFMSVAVNYEYKSNVEDKILLFKKIIEQSKEIAKTQTNNNINDINNQLVVYKDGHPVLNAMVENTISKVLYDEGQKHKYSKKKIYNPKDLNQVKRQMLSFRFKKGEITKKDYESELNKISQSKNKNVTMLSLRYQSKLAKFALRLEDEAAELDIKYEKGLINEDLYQSKYNELNASYESLGGRNLSMTKVSNQLLHLNQMKGMALNATSGFNNFSFGIISILNHANGRIEFDNKHAVKAMGLVFKTRRHKKNQINNKVFNVIKNSNIIYDTIDARHHHISAGEKFKLVNKLDIYYFQSKTEYLIQGVSYIAKMLKAQVKDKNGKNISLYDAFGNDGKIDKSKVSKETAEQWNDIIKPGEHNEFSKFRNSGIELNKMLHGNYDPSSPMYVKNSAIGKALMQYRTWIPEGVASRFKPEYFNEQLGRKIKGRWLTYGELGILGSIKTLLKQITYQKDAFIKDNKIMKDVDIENMRRNLAELGVATSIAGMMMFLKMIINWNDEEENGGIGAASSKMAYNLLFRANQDIYFYNNPSTIQNILRSPLPYTKLFTDASSAIRGSYREATQDNYKGQSWYTKWANVFPISNQPAKLKYMSTHTLESNYGYN